MSELVSLGLQVPGVLIVRRLLEGHAITEPQAVALESNHFARIVRDRANGAEPQIQEDLRADSVVAKVGLEAQPLVRLDGVCPFVLQLIRLELVEESDASAFLIEID